MARRLAQGAKSWLTIAILLGASAPGTATATTDDLARWLPRVFPEASHAGPRDGSPPASAVYRGDELLGYAFFSRDAGTGTGYGGRPIDVAIGLRLDGRIAGAELVEHHEPILIIGVSDEALRQSVRQYAGRDIRTPIRLRALAPKSPDALDGVSGATVSSMALHDAVIGASRAVARARGLIGAPMSGADKLDRESYTPEGWSELVTRGSVVRRTVTLGEAAAALSADVAALAPGASSADSDFVTLFVALATPPQIGRNLLGPAAYERLLADAPSDANLVFVASQGLYSFKGSAWLRTGEFDRLQIVQDSITVTFDRDRHWRIDRLAAADAPSPREAAIFVVPPDTGFDPVRPWRLDLLVADPGKDGLGGAATFSMDYRLPSRHVTAHRRGTADDSQAAPLWQQIWELRAGRLAVLAAALLALYGVLVLQDYVARRRRVWQATRIAALSFTLVWLGWFAGTQLSVVNVLTFADALRAGFEWEFFLRDPLVFVLWSWVAVALLFWGRGVFCGWLCPFGALQELLSAIARRAGIPQLRIPFGLHERLWPTKYIIFLGLLALSLGSMDKAVAAAEVEPFKTAISLAFQREGLFVGYAALLLAAGLFVERFFCRYVCPLGAALAIPARLRMFEWLKRRWQCGRECNICAVRCPVQAIHPNGHINPNECIHCLRCQTLYFDDTVCLPLAARRKRRDEREAALATARARAPSSAE